MAVKLRLKRGGSKQKPFYRIVASDARSPRDVRFIETFVTYNPLKEEYEVTIDEEKALYWLNNGAQPTDTVKSLLSQKGIIAKFTESKTKKSEPKAKKTTTKKTETKSKKEGK